MIGLVPWETTSAMRREEKAPILPKYDCLCSLPVASDPCPTNQTSPQGSTFTQAGRWGGGQWHVEVRRSAPAGGTGGTYPRSLGRGCSRPRAPRCPAAQPEGPGRTFPRSWSPTPGGAHTMAPIDGGAGRYPPTTQRQGTHQVGGGGGCSQGPPK